jgi:hypothetical protein
MRDDAATWSEFESAMPDLAVRVRRLFDAGRHKTIATVRADGGPRISGIECEFSDGHLRFGSMRGARKAADLRRDPRFDLHGPTSHPVVGREHEWPGEAKISGLAEIVTDPDGSVDADMFIARMTTVTVTSLDETASVLVVEWWTPADGLQRVERG